MGDSNDTAETPAMPPCVLGLDIGAYNSKMTLGRKNPRDGRVVIHRVPAMRRTNPTGAGNFEFPALASLDADGRLSIGMDSIKKDITVPVKIIIMYMAGIRRMSTLRKLPGSPELLQAYRQKKLTLGESESAIRRYLSWLRDVATEHARKCKMTIETLSITFPHYLWNNEEDYDFAMFTSYIDNFVCELWPRAKRKYSVSEGQSAAVYATEDFDDPIHGTDPEGRRELFEGLRVNEKGGLNLLIADGGGSSLNLQLQQVWLDEQGHMVKGQSSVGSSRRWLEGSSGGSHVANSEVLQIVQQELAGLVAAGTYTTGEIATFLQDFERQKHDLDYEKCISDGRLIVLHGQALGTILLAPESLDKCFTAAFRDGEKALKTMINTVAKYHRDFAVLLMGGTFQSPTQRRHVAEICEAANRQHKVLIKHAFMADYEPYPSSAVSAGAVLSVLKMPPPASILRGSAIGLQIIVHQQRGMADADRKGTFLFSPGCEPQSMDIAVHAFRGKKAEFGLICDPDYRLQGSPRPSFPIMGAQEVLSTESPVPYDLNWALAMRDLPRGAGMARISISGSRIAALAKDASDNLPEDDPLDGIPFIFSCCQIELGSAMPKNSKDTKWHLVLKTDPASKYLVIEEVRRFPYWCTGCRKELESQVRHCACCRWHVCWECYLLKYADGHPPRHQIIGFAVP